MDTKQILNDAKQSFIKSIEHLRHEFAQIQAGRASAAMVEDLFIEAYGVKAPIKNNAQVSIPDPQSIAIEPWDKSLLSQIEKAVRESPLGVNPTNDGGLIRITLPQLTEEKRKELVKIVHNKGEEAKISLRNSRHDAINGIRGLDNLSEDQTKNAEHDLQDEVNKANKEIDEFTKKKEKDIMTV